MGSEERHKQGFIHNRHFDLLSTPGKNSSVPSFQELDTKSSSLFITLSIQLLPQASGLLFWHTLSPLSVPSTLPLSPHITWKGETIMIPKEKLAKCSLISFLLPRPMENYTSQTCLQSYWGQAMWIGADITYWIFRLDHKNPEQLCTLSLPLPWQPWRAWIENGSMGRWKKSGSLSHCLSTHIRYWHERKINLFQVKSLTVEGWSSP